MPDTGYGASLEALPRLYRDLAPWYPLLTPASDYSEEAAFYLRVFESHCRPAPRTLLDLGCGAGHNASHLKAHLAATLVDLSPDMLALSRKLNPGCAHVQGDMRSARLGSVFDCVLAHDAVCHLTSREDLARAIETAYAHCAPGGAALFQPDFVRETFVAGVESGGSDGPDRALRYLEWRWDPDAADESYVTDMAYVLRDQNGAVEVAHDRFIMGLFERATWMDLIAAAGFLPRAVPFEHSEHSEVACEVFVGMRPGGPDERVGSLT
jgi:SAM-dependent methyltransferase